MELLIVRHRPVVDRELRSTGAQDISRETRLIQSSLQLQRSPSDFPWCTGSFDSFHSAQPAFISL